MVYLMIQRQWSPMIGTCFFLNYFSDPFRFLIPITQNFGV